MANVRVDTGAVDDLAREIEEAKRVLVARLAERGYQLLREEVPKVTTNLQQGVAPPDVDFAKLTAMLTVSARSARLGTRQATLHLKSGKEKTVKLRPTKAYNYAEVVARGAPPTISPKKAKALIIPVATAPTDESYLTIDGKIFVVRKTVKGRKADPFDERAAARLEAEAENIGAAVLREFFE